MGKNLLLGVGGRARHVKALYVGIGGKARKIKKIYVGVGGKARLVYQSYIPVTGISLVKTLTNPSNPKRNCYLVVTAVFKPDNCTNPKVTWKYEGGGCTSILNSTDTTCTLTVSSWLGGSGKLTATSSDGVTATTTCEYDSDYGWLTT